MLPRAGEPSLGAMTTELITPMEMPPALLPGRVFNDAICGVDGTRGSFAAVEQAAALVGRGGTLTLMAVTAVAGAGAYRTALISPTRVDRVLGRAAEAAHAHGVQTARLIDPSGPPAKAIMSQAPRHDLLALGAPSHSPLGRMLERGPSAAAIEAIAQPVLVARPMSPGTGLGDQILLATDGSEESDHLVRLGERLASERNAHVVLLHAAGAEGQSHPHRIARQSDELEQGLHGAAELRVDVGDPRHVIVDAARSCGATLIVMGSHRHGGAPGIGGAARHVIHEADCSVLIVPPARD